MTTGKRTIQKRKYAVQDKRIIVAYQGWLLTKQPHRILIR